MASLRSTALVVLHLLLASVFETDKPNFSGPYLTADFCAQAAGCDTAIDVVHAAVPIHLAVAEQC